MFQTIKEKMLRRRAINKLIHQYEYLNQVNIVLEDYLSGKLLQGGSQEFMAKGRADLATKQGEIKTNKEFLEFLKSK